MASPALLAVTANMAMFSALPGAPVGLTVTETGLVMLPTEVMPMVVLRAVVVLDWALELKVGTMVALDAWPRIVAAEAAAKPTFQVELEAAPLVKLFKSALKVKFIYLAGPCGMAKLMLLKVTV